MKNTSTQISFNTKKIFNTKFFNAKFLNTKFLEHKTCCVEKNNFQHQIVVLNKKFSVETKFVLDTLSSSCGLESRQNARPNAIWWLGGWVPSMGGQGSDAVPPSLRRGGKTTPPPPTPPPPPVERPGGQGLLLGRRVSTHPRTTRSPQGGAGACGPIMLRPALPPREGLCLGGGGGAAPTPLASAVRRCPSPPWAAARGAGQCHVPAHALAHGG